MSQPEDAEPVDHVDGEDTELLVADPDDYHETQRLREIHDAHQDVRAVLDEIERYTTDDEHQRQLRDLADAVTAYLAELEPLIEATDYDDSVEQTAWSTMREYIDLMGAHPSIRDEGVGEDVPSYQHHMFMFRQGNRFLADVKPLVTEDDTDEWEV